MSELDMLGCWEWLALCHAICGGGCLRRRMQSLANAPVGAICKLAQCMQLIPRLLLSPSMCVKSGIFIGSCKTPISKME